MNIFTLYSFQQQQQKEIWKHSNCSNEIIYEIFEMYQSVMITCAHMMPIFIL